MSAAAKGPSRIAPASPALLSAPLDFFFAEHFRQRQLYALLDQLAAAETLDPTLVEPVLDYLRHDMPLHVRDEEEGLFPLMRRRCRPEDEIESVLTKLSTEHAAHRSLARRVIRGLERARPRGRASMPIAACARRCVTTRAATGVTWRWRTRWSCRWRGCASRQGIWPSFPPG